MIPVRRMNPTAEKSDSTRHLSTCRTVADKPQRLSYRQKGRTCSGALSAGVQFADELIAVDTGSADRSREIAREYTDLVFREPWQNRFARARSFAASKAGFDHVMRLDAEDVFGPDDVRLYARSCPAGEPEDFPPASSSSFFASLTASARSSRE